MRSVCESAGAFFKCQHVPLCYHVVRIFRPTGSVVTICTSQDCEAESRTSFYKRFITCVSRGVTSRSVCCVFLSVLVLLYNNVFGTRYHRSGFRARVIRSSEFGNGNRVAVVAAAAKRDKVLPTGKDVGVAWPTTCTAVRSAGLAPWFVWWMWRGPQEI